MTGRFSWPRGRQRGDRIGDERERGEERFRCVEVGATTRRQMGSSRLFDFEREHDLDTNLNVSQELIKLRFGEI